MGIARGTNIIRDGLVFGYDTGYGVADNITSTRFYKGAPTTNPIYNQNAVAQDSYTTYSATSSGTWNAKHPNAIRAYNSQGGDKTGYYNGGVTDATNTYHAVWELDPILNKPVVVMNDVDGQWKAKSFGTGLGSWTSQGKTHGDTYTISWLQWVDNLSKNAKAGLYTKNSSGSSGFHDGQANSTSAYNTELGTWQRVYQTYTTNSNRDLNHSLASIYMYGHYNVRAIVKVTDVQWQWGSTPYPFVEGDVSERSNTQSLIDLKRTASIDVSGMSFDSTGQPTFDGTNDYIPFTSVTLGNGNWSVEFVANAHGSNYHLMSNSSGGPVSNAMGILSNKMYYKNYNGSWQNHSSSTTLNYNQIYHIVFVNKAGASASDGTMDMYINGEKDSNSGFNSYTTNGGPVNAIGRSWAGYFDGDIHVCKRYTSSLLGSEVKQNYKAYKNRFNI